MRNAFRPETVRELIDAFHRAHMDPQIGAIILTGAGDLAFCSGGDQRIRGEEGYRDSAGVQHLNVLELQRQIRTLPKPVVAMVAGYAIGGGHVLHLVCDLTIAADNARFGQTGPRVGSFDAGLRGRAAGAHHRAQKGQGGLVPVPPVRCRPGPGLGPGQRRGPARRAGGGDGGLVPGHAATLAHGAALLKAAFNADTDGLAGIQELAGNATALFYTTDEAQEGRDAFLERRPPDFGRFPRRP